MGYLKSVRMVFHVLGWAFFGILGADLLGNATETVSAGKVQAAAGSNVRKLKFMGKICGGCAKSIKDAMAQVPGVEKTEVDLKKSLVTITAGSQVTNSQMDNAIVAAGFKVKGNEIYETE